MIPSLDTNELLKHFIFILQPFRFYRPLDFSIYIPLRYIIKSKINDRYLVNNILNLTK